MPNFVPMEMQVLAGILPISRVAAVAACVHFAGQHLPIEQIFQLKHPALDEPDLPDKRTWREGITRSGPSPHKASVWTAMDVLTAFAKAKGWVTAKAGRPDIHRAGNASRYRLSLSFKYRLTRLVLRSLAEGRVSWGYLPPGAEGLGTEGAGIWIPGQDVVDTDPGTDGEVTEHEAELSDEEETDKASESDCTESDIEVNVRSTLTSRFGALAIDGGMTSEEESDGEN